MSHDRERWLILRGLLESALEQPAAQRETFVRERCGDDDLVREVLKLLRRDSGLGSYLEPPPALIEASRDLRPREETLSGTQIGVWRLERAIGRGGMGTVYLARRADGDFEQRGALKIIRSGMDSPDMLLRFRRERRLLAQLEHANVARLLDGGVAENGRPFIVMEYVEGRPIDVYCNEQRLSIHERLRLFSRVCAAVHHAHTRLVVHRDLKPGNIFVNAEGEPKLLDFGLAKMLSDSEDSLVTQSGSHALTPAYASPEQIRGDTVTTAGDVYSLGVVLYQLLTGRLPHPTEASSISELGRRICEVEPARPSAVLDGETDALSDPAHLDRTRRQLRGDLDTIVMKALRKEPERRYQSAGQLAEDVERFLAGWPVIAQPDSLTYRTSKFVQRHRALVLVSLLGALALIVGIAVSSNLWLVARRRAAEVTRLSDVHIVQALAEDADRIWPAVPPAEPKMQLWMRQARSLLARQPLHEARRNELRARGREQEGVWSFDSTEAAWEHEVLTRLLAGLEVLGQEQPKIGSLAEMRRRAEFAASVDERTMHSAEAAAAWNEARASIASSPLYSGLEVSPQRGLLPLGVNATTGLWEFWHPQTGARPEPGPRGGFDVDADSALVFVLLPGGTFSMGSPPDEPDHSPEEGPVNTVVLDPFFIAKFELTQGQFERITGTNPAVLSLANNAPKHAPAGLDHPVEGVNWILGRNWLDRAALDFPTEAQWEYAARGGTRTSWWTGAERESLRGAVNLADASAAAHGQDWMEISDWPELDDGFAFHAPVGTYRANPFGLYDVLGNVCEWCDDAFGDYSTPAAPGDGRRSSGYVINRPIRGGGFSNRAAELRCAKRVVMSPEISAPQIGLRPVRKLER